MTTTPLQHRPSTPPVAIAPATLVQARVHRVPGPFTVAELLFDVPLDHRHPEGETLRLFGRAALQSTQGAAGAAGEAGRKARAAGANRPDDRHHLITHRPWLAYLEGGPGAGQREPQNSALTRPLLQRGYQVLFLDYRGTGLSTPVSAATLQARGDGSAAAQAAYLQRFRADSIVHDLEAVRRCLVGLSGGSSSGGGSGGSGGGAAADTPWSLLGHSFGGFVSLTYLSFYPEGVREVFLTGGLAPIARGPDDVYRATYGKALQRNAAYFRKFPEDVAALLQIAAHLDAQPGGRLPLPGGGALTTARLLTAGYMFGFHGGLDSTHALVLRMRLDLAQAGGVLTRATLVAAEQFLPLDTIPLYALLHEAIYCNGPGVASRWAAQRVGEAMAEYRWLRGEGIVPPPAADGQHTHPFLSGEMIYPFMFDTFPELMAVKEAAHLLAAHDAWEALYDLRRLAANRVPVYAASYVDDLYVDFELARETAGLVGNVHVYETSGLYHNALRARADEVLAQLFRLRDDSLD